MSNFNEAEYEEQRQRFEAVVVQMNQARENFSKLEQQAVELQGVLKYLDSKRPQPEPEKPAAKPGKKK